VEGVRGGVFGLRGAGAGAGEAPSWHQRRADIVSGVTNTQQPRVVARIVAQDPDYCLAIWHQTVVSIFRGPASTEHVASISKQCRALLDSGSRSVTYLSVIERSSPAPSEPVRRELAHWSRDVVAKLSAAVIVAEGGGFKNAIVRGVGIALTVLAPHKVPFKFASTVAEASELIAGFIPDNAGGMAELTRAVNEVRERWSAAQNARSSAGSA
jgi:hypothetical protein